MTKAELENKLLEANNKIIELEESNKELGRLWEEYNDLYSRYRNVLGANMDLQVSYRLLVDKFVLLDNK